MAEGFGNMIDISIDSGQSQNTGKAIRRRFFGIKDKISVQLGGSNTSGGIDISLKGLHRVRMLLIAFFIVMIVIIGMLYRKHYSQGRTDVLELVPKQLSPYASPDDFVNGTIPCISPNEHLLDTWIHTSEACSSGSCINFHELVTWQKSCLNTNANWLNFVCTVFMHVGHTKGIAMPCACTVSLINQTQLFMIAPTVISRGEQLAYVTDSLPIVNITKATRKIPTWIGLEYSPWPPDGKKWKNIEIKGKDVNTILRAIDIMNRNSENIRSLGDHYVL